MTGAAGRRDRLVDSLFFLLAIVFTALTLIDSLDRNDAPAVAYTDAIMGVLASMGVWWRRRWPIGFAAFAGILSVYSVSASGVALLALFTVAVHRRALVAVMVAVGFSLASLASLLVRPDLAQQNWPVAVLGTICVTAVLAWGMLIRTRRQAAQSRRDQAAAAQERQLTEARQLERQRIAREMHDVLGHRLSLLSLHAGALQVWPDAPPAEIARTAGIIGDAAHQAMQDLREVIGVLRSESPGGEVLEPPQPTLAGLAGLIGDSQEAGMQVTLDCEIADLEAIPETTGRTAYRIVQEGLTNARKHAPSASVSVSVKGNSADGLTVEVQNSMTNPVLRHEGAGLIGLAERAELAGGRLEHGRTATGDFRLWAWLPWPA